MSHSDTIERTRPRSGGDVPPPRPLKRSNAVTNLLAAVGVVSEAGGDVLETGIVSKSSETLPKSTKLSKRESDKRYKQFGDRVKGVTEAIDADIKVLEMIPGTDDLVADYRRRQKAATAPQAEGKWDVSYTQLQLVQGLLHNDIVTRQKELTKTLVDSGPQRKKYEELHTALHGTCDLLREYPDGETFVNSLIEQQLKSAEIQFEADRFEPALVTLNTLTKVAKDQLDIWKKQDGDLRGRLSKFDDVYTLSTKLETEIKAAELILGPSAVQPFNDRNQKIYKDMLGATNDGYFTQGDTAKGFKTALREVWKDLGAQVNRASIKRDEAVGKADEFQRRIGVDGELQTPDVTRAAYQSLTQIRNAIATYKYDDALLSCSTLEQTMSTWDALPQNPKDLQKKMVEVFVDPATVQIGRATQLVKDAKLAPVLDTPPTAASVLADLDDQMKLYRSAPQTFPLSEGLAAVKRATTDNDTNETRLAAYRKLTATRTKLDKQIQALASTVEDSLAEMRDVLAQRGTPVTTLPSYETVLADALADWKDASIGAARLDDMRFDEIFARLDSLREAINDDTRNDSVLDDKGKEGQFAALRDAFNAATGKVDTAVDLLMETDYDQGDAARTNADGLAAAFIKAIAAHNADAAQKLIDQLETIARTATEQANKSVTALSGNKLALEELHHAIDGDIGGLVTMAADKKKKCTDYAKLAAALQLECDQLGATVASNDITVINGSLDQLRALRGKVEELKALFQKLNGKTLAKTDLTIDRLKSRAGDIPKGFNDKIATQYEAGTLKTITDKRQAIIDEIGTIPLAASKTKLDELEAEYAALQQTATTHKTEAETFIQQVELTLQFLDQQVWLTPLADYKKTLLAKLKVMTTAATKDGTIDKTGLDELKADVKEAETHREVGDRKNALAQTDALAEALAEKKWIADYAAFQGKLKGLATVRKSLDGDDVESFDSQTKAVTDAGSLIKKKQGTVPYKEMCDQLAILMSNVDTMILYPRGKATHSRGEIKPANQAWNAAVDGFHTALGSLATAVAKAATGDGRAGDIDKAVAGEVQKARELIMANTLTAPCEKVQNAIGDISAARDAREEAMREVKRLQRLLEGSPRLMPLQNNPFGVDVTTPIANMIAALFSVETTLAISL